MTSIVAENSLTPYARTGTVANLLSSFESTYELYFRVALLLIRVGVLKRIELMKMEFSRATLAYCDPQSDGWLSRP